jgi:hypothetical protein
LRSPSPLREAVHWKRRTRRSPDDIRNREIEIARSDRETRITKFWNFNMKRSVFICVLAARFATIGWCLEKEPSEGRPTRVPVLVELFTSEGCSSCPPADEWLRQLDTTQPVTGAQLIVLSEHVDYWDHDGWKDPYSSSASTQRQSEYAHAFRLDSPYTPQAIVNGNMNLKLDDAQQIRQTFEQAAADSTVPIAVTSVAIDRENPAIVRALVEVNGTASDRSADIFAAVALDHAESVVLHGENHGKHLNHVAVVRQLTRIGKMEKRRTFKKLIELKLNLATDPRNARLIIFVQEPGSGKVLGAAQQDPIS